MAGTIATVTDLGNAIIEYTARDQDLVFQGRIPYFIQQFEAKMNRELFCRQMEVRSTTVIDTTLSEPEFLALPVNFQSMRRIRLSSVSGKPSLQFMAGTQADEYRTCNGDVAGQPQFFTIFGAEIELVPNPDANYTVEMIYRSNIPTLINNVSGTNWLLALAPDLYLYGCLLETAPYIQNDQRIETWNGLYQTALAGLNNLSLVSSFNAGPATVRVSGATP